MWQYVMGAEDGSIVQLGQCVGMKKALAKMADMALSKTDSPEQKRLMISHCNNPEAAEYVLRHMEGKITPKETLVLDMAGVSSMYANEGGVIMTI